MMRLTTNARPRASIAASVLGEGRLAPRTQASPRSAGAEGALAGWGAGPAPDTGRPSEEPGARRVVRLYATTLAADWLSERSLSLRLDGAPRSEWSENSIISGCVERALEGRMVPDGPSSPGWEGFARTCRNLGWDLDAELSGVPDARLGRVMKNVRVPPGLFSGMRAEVLSRRAAARPFATMDSLALACVYAAGVLGGADG